MFPELEVILSECQTTRIHRTCIHLNRNYTHPQLFIAFIYKNLHISQSINLTRMRDERGEDLHLVTVKITRKFSSIFKTRLTDLEQKVMHIIQVILFTNMCRSNPNQFWCENVMSITSRSLSLLHSFLF